MVQIITDSAADLEPQELKEKNIICVPMKILFGEDEYTENANLSKDKFYELLETSTNFPKTSQPTPYDFESCIQKFKDKGDQCVVITISSALSGTYQSALLTKNMLDFDDCYVIDSLNAACGQRLLVDEAVRLRDSGKSAAEIAAVLDKLKQKVRLVACIDTLEYLYKGGRLSKTAYSVGSMINIKPIIKVSAEGKVEVCGKTLNIRQGIRNICDSLSKNPPSTDYPIYVVYSHHRKNADILADSIRKSGHEVLEENIVSIGAAIGSHIGKGACGYAYITQ